MDQKIERDFGTDYRKKEFQRKSDISKMMYKIPISIVLMDVNKSLKFYGYKFEKARVDLLANTQYIGGNNEKYLNSIVHYQFTDLKPKGKNKNVTKAPELSRNARNLKRKMKQCKIYLTNILEDSNIKVSKETADFIKTIPLVKEESKPLERLVNEINRSTVTELDIKAQFIKHDWQETIETSKNPIDQARRQPKTIDEYTEYIVISDNDENCNSLRINQATKRNFSDLENSDDGESMRITQATEKHFSDFDNSEESSLCSSYNNLSTDDENRLFDYNEQLKCNISIMGNDYGILPEDQVHKNIFMCKSPRKMETKCFDVKPFSKASKAVGDRILNNRSLPPSCNVNVLYKQKPFSSPKKYMYEMNIGIDFRNTVSPLSSSHKRARSHKKYCKDQPIDVIDLT